MSRSFAGKKPGAGVLKQTELHRFAQSARWQNRARAEGRACGQRHQLHHCRGRGVQPGGGERRGKSTAARTIIRLLTPTSGEIIYRGKDIAPLKDNELLPYRKKIQMIFQDPYSSLDPRQKVKDILMEPILFHKLAPNRKGRRDALL